jgi:hypothetical protein
MGVHFLMRTLEKKMGVHLRTLKVRLTPQAYLEKKKKRKKFDKTNLNCFLRLKNLKIDKTHFQQ